MDTTELIKALAADTRPPAPSLSSVWWGAVGLGIGLAAAVFFALLGPRPDIAAAAETPRFLFKFVVTTTLAVSAFGLARALSRPGETWRKAMPYLAAAPSLIAMAIIAEIVALPPGTWWGKLVGTNSIACLTYIPLIGIGPLAIFVLALRHGAPTRPAFAGAVAGLAAGGAAGPLFSPPASHGCPPFVATWYPIAIAGLALIGAATADRFAHW